MAKIGPAPTNTAPISKEGLFVSVWVQMFTQWFTGLLFPAASNPPPASSASAIQLGGGLAYDQNYLYVSVGKDKWKRVPLTAF